MTQNTRIAIKADNAVGILDLEDFPHGQLENIRKDDKYDIEFYSVPPSIKVKSYNPETCRVEWMPVKFWSVHRGKQVEIVTLSDGSQIYTDNDPRAIYGVAADATTVIPSRFTPSDAQAHNVLVPISPAPLDAAYSGLWYDFGTGLITEHKGTCSAAVDFDLGQFIGIMAGDGWADINDKAWLADGTGYNYKYVAAFLSKVYPEFYAKEYALSKDIDPTRYGNSVKYRLNVDSMQLGKRIKELVDGHGDNTTSGSANKRLPLWYQFGGTDFIRGIVCGLIATDGTVSITHGKKKPQLEIQLTSTSLRLCREFQRCCRILGVRCSVAFSKTTSRGNTSWLCMVSTPAAKHVDLLRGCCHEDKLKRFNETVVSQGTTDIRSDFVPFTGDISREIVALIPAVAPKHRKKTPEETKQATMCTCVRRDAYTGRITRWRVRTIVEFANKAADEATELYDKALAAFTPLFKQALAVYEDRPAGAIVRELGVPITKEEAETIRAGIIACRSRLTKEKDPILEDILKITYFLAQKPKLTCVNASRIKNFFDTYRPNTELRDSAALKKLVELADSPVRWEDIEKVEKTGVEVVGYDLTVPGYDTFMNADGVILSNTMNFHVPSSDKAVEEAIEKMLPSKNLFSTTDLRSPRYVPMMEMTLGLAKLTAPASKEKPRVFVTKQDAIRAYRRGELTANTPITVLRQ